MDSTNGDIRRGKWTIEEKYQRVRLSWGSDFVWETLSLPLDPKGAWGKTHNSPIWRVEAVKIR